MPTSASAEPEFSRLRALVWPVHQYELKKLFPMLLMFFLVYFDYNVLRVMKDTLVVTAKSSGAEVIPFIKLWAMFPSAIFLTFLFTRLSNRLTRESVFYVIMGLFLGYFFLFAFFLYPARDFLHPHASADLFEALLPLGFKGLVAMYRNWTFTIFYVMSELWSSIILSVLLWGFANQITRVGEAKRFYALLGIGGNFSGVVAGQAAIYLYRKELDPSLPFGTDAWGQSMILLISLVILSGILTLAIFRWMNKQVLTDPRFYDPSEARKEQEVKGKLSMRESISYLLSSKYMICIAIIVISYNLVINLVEVPWKHQVRELYPSPGDYNLYMNHVTSMIGIVATFTALFISGNSIRRVGWTFTALLTPTILLVTSIGFFTFFFAKGELADTIVTLLGASPLALVVFFGTTQNVMSRGAKYTVFDATKELAFVPLSPELQLKGKPTIDGVCSRLGKSGGSFVHQTLLILTSTVSASAPFVAAILLGIIVIWIIAVRVLGKQFNELTANTFTPAEVLSVKVKAPGLTESIVPERQAI